MTVQLLRFGLGEEPSVEIGLATDDEIAAVTNDLAVDGDVRRQIDDWHLIAIRIRPVQQITLHLIGRYQPLRRLISSPVVALATDRRRAKTLNSVYQLADPATESLPAEALARVAARMILRASGGIAGDIARISGEFGHA